MKTGPPGLLGTNAGAPDLMFTQAAACTNSGCTPQDPLYDYATDVEPQQGADLDRGLQLTTPDRQRMPPEHRSPAEPAEQPPRAALE